MKVTFNKYTYFDEYAQDEKTYSGTAENSQYADYAFDSSKFNKLITDRQYEAAADYAAMYHFNDPKIQREHENDIINLRRNGRILGAIYSRIDKKNLPQIEFYDNVFVDGGLETLSNNEYVKQFEEYKRRLGSSIKKEATKLDVTFAPEIQKLFGIDWLMPDNKNNIDNFYKNSGLNEQQLKAYGVEVILKDGYTTLRFDKSNPLANKILVNIPDSHTSRGDNLSFNFDTNVSITGLNRKNNIIKGGINNVKQIKDFINAAKSTKDEYFQKVGMTTKDYSSTIGPAIDDNLEALQYAYNSGQIDETTFNKERKLQAGYIENAIKTLGSGNYEMYTNGWNDESTDETLVEADNIQRGEIINFLSAANPKNMHFNAMISNGKIGTLVTVDAEGLTTDQKKDIKSDDTIEDMVKGRRYQVFIPGLMQEQAQAKINRNTSTRAIQELNSMQDWGYSYKVIGGTRITPYGNGKYTIGDDYIITKDEAIRYINKDMIIRGALHNLKYEYLTWDDKLAGKESYEQMARLIAVRSGNELFPNVTLQDVNGKAYTIDDLFNHKGLVDGNYVFNNKNPNFAHNMNYQVIEKIRDIYDIYDAIMKGLNYYDIDPNFKLTR